MVFLGASETGKAGVLDFMLWHNPERFAPFELSGRTVVNPAKSLGLNLAKAISEINCAVDSVDCSALKGLNVSFSALSDSIKKVGCGFCFTRRNNFSRIHYRRVPGVGPIAYPCDDFGNRKRISSVIDRLEHKVDFVLLRVRNPLFSVNSSRSYINPLPHCSRLQFSTSVHSISGTTHFDCLISDGYACPKGNAHQQTSQNIVGERQFVGSTPRSRLLLSFLMEVGGLIFSCVGTFVFVIAIFHHNNRRRWIGGILAVVGYLGFCAALFSLFIDRLPWEWRQWLREDQDQGEKEVFHGGTIVLQKYLTELYSCSTVIDMANILDTDKQIAVIGALAEGSSIRSIERMTGIHRDTIMRLGVRVGQGCSSLLDAKMRDLPCHHLQFDEIWGFIGKKQRNLLVDDDETQYGDVWTFCAIDAETKLVPSFRCGKRDAVTANAFVEDVASRMRTRVQVTTDALRLYVEAIERGFGADVDYGRVIKTYAHDDSIHPERRYSAPEIVTTEKEIVNGNPDMELASTSHVERLNGTTRLHMRRLTRLTYAFSKKLENFKAAAALHFAYYNLVKRHNSLRCTPAMAAGVEQTFWSVGDLIEAVA